VKIFILTFNLPTIHERRVKDPKFVCWWILACEGFLSSESKESSARSAGHLNRSGTLIIVPCGKRKIWDVNPNAGPTIARLAYTGSLFNVNRAYAQKHADRWVVLSAKYGFIDSDFTIPRNYDVSFGDERTGPIGVKELRRQVEDKGLNKFNRVVALGGKTYADIVDQAFSPFNMRVEKPFQGLSIGRMMSAVKKACQQ